MKEIEEGFYIAHLRDEDLFCYIHREEEKIFAALPDGEQWPVLSHSGSWPYILQENLEPTDPEQFIKQALDTIKFIYTNMGRLHEKQSKLEASV